MELVYCLLSDDISKNSEAGLRNNLRGDGQAGGQVSEVSGSSCKQA